jgi:plasmid maintenance system antidote protein VapI
MARVDAARDLRKALMNRGLSQEEAARLLGVPRENVTRWVNGSRVPSLKHALLLETEFGIGVRRWVTFGYVTTE